LDPRNVYAHALIDLDWAGIPEHVGSYHLTDSLTYTSSTGDSTTTIVVWEHGRDFLQVAIPSEVKTSGPLRPQDLNLHGSCPDDVARASDDLVVSRQRLPRPRLLVLEFIDHYRQKWKVNATALSKGGVSSSIYASIELAPMLREAEAERRLLEMYLEAFPSDSECRDRLAALDRWRMDLDRIRAGGRPAARTELSAGSQANLEARPKATNRRNAEVTKSVDSEDVSGRA